MPGASAAQWDRFPEPGQLRASGKKRVCRIGKHPDHSEGAYDTRSNETARKVGDEDDEESVQKKGVGEQTLEHRPARREH